jgi:hypothetical protein
LGPSRAPITTIISLDVAPAKDWAARIEAHLKEKFKGVFALAVSPGGSLTDVIKDARKRGAHRILAVGDHRFVDWASQAMMGSLMPLAPALLPGSRPVLGHSALTSQWQEEVEKLLFGRFMKIDMAVGASRPFVHELVAGFPVSRDSNGWGLLAAALDAGTVDLSIEVDRAQASGAFWAVVIANGDFPNSAVRWIAGANPSDQCLDVLLVRPCSLWQRLKFLLALRKGTHGALPGVMRFRGHRVTIKAAAPWRCVADGGDVQEISGELVLEAKPEKLRVVAMENRR